MFRGVGMSHSASILIVEDDQHIRDLLTRSLERSGYIVHTTANGLEAIETLKTEHFDLIITDLKMPEMSGNEFIEYIQSDFSLSQTPIMVMSAVNDYEEIKSCLSKGVVDYILKPLNTLLLQPRVQSCLAKKTSHFPTDKQTIKEMFGEKVALVVDDHDISRDLLAQRLVAEGISVHKVGSGEMAMEALGQPVDMIFLDYNLPGMGGLEIVKSIREKSELADIPIVMVTGEASEEAISDCINAGANDHLIKPYSAPLLKTRLRSLLLRKLVAA